MKKLNRNLKLNFNLNLNLTLSFSLHSLFISFVLKFPHESLFPQGRICPERRST